MMLVILPLKHADSLSNKWQHAVCLLYWLTFMHFCAGAQGCCHCFFFCMKKNSHCGFLTPASSILD